MKIFFNFSIAGLLTCFWFSISCGVIDGQGLSIERGKDSVSITRSFDAAKNETTVSVIPGFVHVVAVQLLNGSPDGQRTQITGFTLRAIVYSYAGNVPTRPQIVNFIFASDGRKLKYNESTEFRLDADGSTISQGKINYSVADTDEGKVEFLTVSVASDLFLNIGRANKIHFSFGTKTYKLSSAEKEDVRALAGTIP
jgi:hypothetical protein